MDDYKKLTYRLGHQPLFKALEKVKGTQKQVVQIGFRFKGVLDWLMF